MKLNYVDLLRDVGVHFSVNKMLSAECFKSRWETGLTFIELNYMIMQSYDFHVLFQKYGCTMQLGGNDQWGNITSGVELVRKMDRQEVYGLTFTLLTNKDGVKMGKTMGGAVWLDKEKFPVYDFFQYWRNVDDAEVIKCLKMLTFLPIEEIEAMEAWEGAKLNEAKEILAWELTKDVHGKEEADKALEAARAVFGGGGVDANMPTTTLADDDFTDGAISLLDLLVKTGLTPSKGEGRRLIAQNGVSLDCGDGKFTPVTDIAFALQKADMAGKNIVIKKGKKVFHKVIG
jgi:tyrosyl-tRNA synthetase